MPELPPMEPYRDLPLEVEVRIDTVSMPLRELLALEPGQLIRTARPVGDPLSVLVGEVPVGLAELDPEAEGKAIRVTAIERPEEWS